MKLIRFLIAAVMLSLLALPFKAMAVTAYNQNVTAIYGGGNPDGGWTTDTGSGLTLALRAKGRNDTAYAGTTPNGGTSTYTFATQQGVRGAFNYDFSINTGTATLSSYDFYLVVDQDHSMGVSPVLVNPLTYWIDNSFGNGSTANGAGLEGPFLGTFLNDSVAQNSQNPTFGGATGYPGGPLSVVADATYSYELFAVQNGAGSNGARLASVSMSVVIGNGGAAVPDGGYTIAMLFTGLTCMGLVSHRIRKKAV